MGDNNSMTSEALEEYALASSEESYKDPGKQATTRFMAPGVEFNDRNDYHWVDQKQPSFTSSN